MTFGYGRQVKMSADRSQLQNLLLRLIGRRKAEIRTSQDLRYLKALARYVGLMMFLVVLPVVALAILSLRSLNAEEAAEKAKLKDSAETITAEVHRQLRTELNAFDRAAMSEEKAKDPKAALSRRFPYLMEVYRFGPNGDLESPVVWNGHGEPWHEPSALWTKEWHAGQRAEARRPPVAAAHYLAAAEASPDPNHTWTARFAAARALSRIDEARAEELLQEIVLQDRNLRDVNGFPLDGLATYTLSQLYDQQGKHQQATAQLERLVRRTLAHTWALDDHNEAFLLRRALEELEGRSDATWLNTVRRMTERRMQGLHLALNLEDELRRISFRESHPDGVQFYSRKKALWAVASSPRSTLVHAIDAEALRTYLNQTVVSSINQTQAELTTTIIHADTYPGPALYLRTLAPELPLMAVVVRPADPQAFTRKLSRLRWLRVATSALALLAIATGLITSFRVVDQQLAHARAKTDFAANVSHELRSPITQIRLKAESLELGLFDDPEELQLQYEAILREADRLSRLVDNVLDFASIEKGTKKYALRPADLGEVIYRALDAVKISAQQSNVELEARIPGDIPVLWMDTDAMGQVLTNLLSNAVKYGAEGGWVGISVIVQEDGVTIDVEDRGIGISKEDQQYIFEHFYRASDPAVRRKKGTGIGLAIVRYIVEAHGGLLSVRSQPGQGSTFTVSLPFQPPTIQGH